MKTLLTLITLTSLIFISCAESEGNLSEIDGRGYSDPSRLVSTEWLESEIDNEEIIIIDVRKKEDYDKGHIPGAFHMTPGEVFQQEINVLLFFMMEILIYGPQEGFGRCKFMDIRILNF